MKKILLLLTVILFLGDARNSWQPFQPFSNNSSGVLLPKAGNLIFKDDLINGITPQVGTAGSFARASTEYLATSNVALTTVTSGNAAIPTFLFGGSGVGSGIQIQGARTNKITDSDDLTQASWTTVGSLTTLSFGANGSPDAGVANSTNIVATSNNSGRNFQTAIAAANNSFIWSLYMKTTSGTAQAAINIQGTGGTPEILSSGTININTTWQRFVLPKTFTGAATGNVNVGVVYAGGNGSLCFGAQLEQVNDATNPMAHTAGASALIRTSGAAASTVADNLNYPSSNVNVSVGTVTVWVCPSFSSAQVSASTEASILSMSGGASVWGLGLTNGNIRDNYNTAQLSSTTTWTANTCFNIGWTFDDPNNIRQIYQNGSFISNSVVAITAPVAAAFNVGILNTLAANTGFDGIIANIRIWNVVLSSTDLTQVFNAERARFGI